MPFGSVEFVDEYGGGFIRSDCIIIAVNILGSTRWNFDKVNKKNGISFIFGLDKYCKFTSNPSPIT
jgi:hypothetical protein